MAADPRFKVGVDLDGKLFGAERNARLDRPFLWIQSGTTQTAEYTQGRDRFLAGLRDGGALLTVRGSIHTSFTDGPSYLTALGRSLIGGATVGSISVQDMTAMTDDTIAAFAGPALGAKNGRSLDQVIARHPTIRSERRIAPKPS
jgi:platelet-activating factor acetylhydrolase isoform II